MRTISTETPNFVPSIIDENGNVKEWQEWPSSFDDILKHVRFFPYCNNGVDVTIVYYMIGLLYKIESNMGNVTIEVNTITYEKWSKCLNDLNSIGDATWPDIDIGIAIWEVIVH